MRFPWHGQGSDSGDLDALQTDVMRFIAILGLCLAAIFSLVQSATVERQSSAAPAPKPVVHAARALEPVNEEPVVIETIRVPSAPDDPAPVAAAVPSEVASPDPAPGFTLEFESDRAMRALLQSRQVRFYARRGESFWSLDQGGEFVAVDAPAAYHEMAAETVPSRLRRALPASADLTWGVTLPAHTMEQAQQIMTRQEPGSLFIQSTGDVSYSRHRE